MTHVATRFWQKAACVAVTSALQLRHMTYCSNVGMTYSTVGIFVPVIQSLEQHVFLMYTLVMIVQSVLLFVNFKH